MRDAAGSVSLDRVFLGPTCQKSSGTVASSDQTKAEFLARPSAQAGQHRAEPNPNPSPDTLTLTLARTQPEPWP